MGTFPRRAADPVHRVCHRSDAARFLRQQWGDAEKAAAKFVKHAQWRASEGQRLLSSSLDATPAQLAALTAAFNPRLLPGVDRSSGPDPTHSAHFPNTLHALHVSTFPSR